MKWMKALIPGMILMLLLAHAGAATTIDLSGSDPRGDVSDPSIDIVSASVREESSDTYTGSQVVFHIEVAGDFRFDDSNYTYTIAISDGGVTSGALITFSGRSAVWGTYGAYSSNLSFSGGANYINIYVPASFFQNLGPIDTVVINAEDGDGNGDVLILKAQADGGSGDDSGGEQDSTDDGSSDSESSTPGFDAMPAIGALSLAAMAYELGRKH